MRRIAFQIHPLCVVFSHRCRHFAPDIVAIHANFWRIVSPRDSYIRRCSRTCFRRGWSCRTRSVRWSISLPVVGIFRLTRHVPRLCRDVQTISTRGIRSRAESTHRLILADFPDGGDRNAGAPEIINLLP
jgi:hypothetical protein